MMDKNGPIVIDLDKNGIVPKHEVPGWAAAEAIRRGVHNNFLIKSWGGLGDIVCAEPAIRWGLKMFPKQKISLATDYPEVFTHLDFHEVLDTKKVRPISENYLEFKTIKPPSSLLWQFASHLVTHCVDFPSLCMWRATMPNEDKEIKLPNYSATLRTKEALADKENTVVLHPGKHWNSKTFPVNWWNDLISTFLGHEFKVVIIGKNVDDQVGYVDVNAKGCIDLRDKLNICELIYLLKSSRYVFSNDSSPIHIAAAGDAFIGFVATCKHPDYITHWRKGEFGYKTQNFGLDGMWNYLDQSPVQEKEVTAEFMEPGLMEKILPPPIVIVEYYDRLRE